MDRRSPSRASLPARLALATFTVLISLCCIFGVFLPYSPLINSISNASYLTPDIAAASAAGTRNFTKRGASTNWGFSLRDYSEVPVGFYPLNGQINTILIIQL
jgi:hypothetical protein